MITHSVVRLYGIKGTPHKSKIWASYLDNYNIQRRMNKQSGFNAEQINKDKNPESKKNRLKTKSKITSYHNRIKIVRLLNQRVITREDNIFSQSFPLSSETYPWLLVSKLTTRVTSQALK